MNNYGFLTGIIGSLVAGVGALVASYIAARFSKERKQNIEELKAEKKRKLIDELMIEGNKLREAKGTDGLARTFKEIVYKNIYEDKKFIESVAAIPAWSKEDIQKEVEETINGLKERVEAIENRFPSSGFVNKEASANDAILAIKVEVITEAIKRLESQIISKWDVAKIVFQIIGALGGLIALSLAVINFYIKNTAGGG